MKHATTHTTWAYNLALVKISVNQRRHSTLAVITTIYSSFNSHIVKWTKPKVCGASQRSGKIIESSQAKHKITLLLSSSPAIPFNHIGHAKVDLKFYLSNYFETSTLYGTIYLMKDVIVAFDKFLTNLDLNFEAILIGGAVLNILDISSRKTKDVDCLDPDLHPEIKKASEEFADERDDLGLDRDWLNNGPRSLKTDLPPGWRSRTRPLFKGNSLILYTLGREDFLKSKLYAYCDRTTPDFEDLKDLRPTKAELHDAQDWVKQRDAHANWPAHVEKAFDVLKKALGHV